MSERHRRQVMMTADEANDATGRKEGVCVRWRSSVTKVIHLDYV